MDDDATLRTHALSNLGQAIEDLVENQIVQAYNHTMQAANLCDIWYLIFCVYQ